jgi:hypothetical protein
VDDFVIARNPDDDSSLPYLVRVPVPGSPVALNLPQGELREVTTSGTPFQCVLGVRVQPIVGIAPGSPWQNAASPRAIDVAHQ